METKRVIGEFHGSKTGPTVFVTAGIHGNEPSGVVALQRVFTELERSRPKITGCLIGIAGNMAALHKNVRFIDEDLNRTWTKEKLDATENLSSEEKEMNDILQIVHEKSANNITRYFLDCHTTSSESLPYISVQDVGENNAWAHRFPVYIVKGFSDIVNGSIDKYFSKIGMTGFTFEAGQHVSEKTAKYHEALIWLILKEANDLNLADLSHLPEGIELFKKNDDIERKTFQIIYRHGLSKNDSFQMEPGFENFQKISEGELLAHQNGKEIRSSWDAHIFMPLYQTQGNDGFFVVKEEFK